MTAQKLQPLLMCKGEGFLTGNETVTISGDASGSGTTGITVTLANSGVSAGTTSGITVDAKGRITAITGLVLRIFRR